VVMDKPIGVFDSGVGGLTVVREIFRVLPSERVVYFGDTARVPYGTRSAETVRRYAAECAEVLYGHDIKMLVLACNTTSAVALTELREHTSVPVIGVVEPGACAAVAATGTGRIGVIGTTATVESNVYAATIGGLAREMRVFSRACPLFVPLAEEGLTEGPIPEQVAQHYLAPLLANQIDTLVLGCTHYPLLRDVIARVVGSDVRIVDSARATAENIVELLNSRSLRSPNGKEPRHAFLVTDAPRWFADLGQKFLGRGIGDVIRVETGCPVDGPANND